MNAIKINSNFKWVAAGLTFAILWPSASTATKVGLTVAQPLVIALTRFAIASAVMISFAHVIKRHRYPTGDEWKQIAIYGLLNITIYLGLYVVAMQSVTAGIGALAVATNPIFILFMSVLILKRQLTSNIVLSIIVCTIGVIYAAWPLFAEATVSVNGLLILLISMLSYSVAAIYFSQLKWNGLSLFVINGWQTLIGGLFLVPFTVIFYEPSANQFIESFWYAVFWLAIPVSIFAVQLWMWLLQVNEVKAGLWLFLCPLFGYFFAAWWMGDSVSSYTIAGVSLVIGGLFLSKFNTKRNEMVFD
ncbi:MAG: DMT family transporter [Saprospiraceae bacterium]|jgi:probable blue pigment (indigoidine) exporter|nr:DMT family transporter [Saprospiraceae bacterium]MBP6565641.1 DMT family transporter [Saprospiraceae bacterium]